MLRAFKRLPSVFVGSSSEAREIGDALQINLKDECEVTVWPQARNEKTHGTLENLIKLMHSFDFAILVFASDDVVHSREHDFPAPGDNVVLELGLFIGAIDRDRTFILYDEEKEPKLPSDLAGVELVRFRRHQNGNLQASLGSSATELKEKIRRLGPRKTRHGEFAICLPTERSSFDGFNHLLKYHLMELLVREGIKMLDYCPEIASRDSASRDSASSDSETLARFRRKIDELVDKERPAYLLVIWPALVYDNNRTYVLESLRPLVRSGCRIGFINEFPDTDNLGVDFQDNVRFIRVDATQSVKLLCSYIKTNICDSAHVLLIHANQQFQVARKRKELYEEQLSAMGLTYEPREIDSWDFEDARGVVRKELKKVKAGARNYDVIAAANDTMAKGAVKALQEYRDDTGMTLDTKVIGHDALPSALDMIRDEASSFVATFAASAYAYAFESFRALCKYPTHYPDREVVISVGPGDLKTKENVGGA